jgi:serine/threonine protein kinase
VDQQVGTDIPGYRIESVIGRGGMGVVYLAKDEHLKRKVALKASLPSWPKTRSSGNGSSESPARGFPRSPQHHPDLQAREAGPSLYIAMRYVPGMDLKSLIAEEGPLSPERTVSILG